MSVDQTMNAVYLVLCLALVGGALIGMRLPVGKALKMALAWIAIFGIGFALFTFRGEFSAVGARLLAEATGAPIQAGEEVRIAMRDDGHFWVTANVNGQAAPFLVDSGASITTLSSATATAAGIEAGTRMARVETANGAIGMPIAKVSRFEVGQIVRADFTIHVNRGGDTNVLGMNFLSSLESWRVEGNMLVLRP